MLLHGDCSLVQHNVATLQVTIGLLKKAMLKSSSNAFLIDGFPRALDQAQSFEEQIQPCEMVSLESHVHGYLP